MKDMSTHVAHQVKVESNSTSSEGQVSEAEVNFNRKLKVNQN